MSIESSKTSAAKWRRWVKDNIGSGTPEGTDVLSTGETGGNKFLGEDGDGTSSWKTIVAGAEANDLNEAVTWANVPNANITEGSVTQHEAALTILESQLSTPSADVGDTLVYDGTNWVIDMTQLIKQVDDVSGTTYYIGEAQPGTATSTSSWRVKRIVFTGDDSETLFADGDANFNNIWDNRASLSYS